MAFHALRISLYVSLWAFSVIILGLTADRVNYTKHLKSPDRLHALAGHYYDPIIVELLATSIFTIIWSSVIPFVLIGRKARGIMASYASENIGLFTLWVMYLVGAAIATRFWHDTSFCWSFRQCKILTSIVAFSWINWAFLTFLMLSSCGSARSVRGGFRDPLHGEGVGRNYAGPETKNVDSTSPVSAA